MGCGGSSATNEKNNAQKYVSKYNKKNRIGQPYQQNYQ